MSNVQINYKKIIKDISKQFQIVFDELLDSEIPEITEEIKKIKALEVVDEQNFVKNDVDKKDFVRIVVKFGAGTINYGSSVCPITLFISGSQNKVKAAQMLISAFASRWTTLHILEEEEDVDEQTTQVWNTPEIIYNFNAAFDGFYNLFRLSGTLVIGNSVVSLGTLFYVYDLESFENSNGEEGYEEIKVMSFNDSLSTSVDPQPFGNTYGFVKSEVSFSTYSFSFSTYLLNNRLTSDLMAIKGFRKRNGSGNGFESVAKNNKTFILRLEFSNGYNNFPIEEPSPDDIVLGDKFYCSFKLVSAGITMSLGEIPSLTVSFTR